MSTKHTEEFCSYLSSVSTRLLFFFLPLHSPPFCFLRYPWKCILSSLICPSVSSHNIIEGRQELSVSSPQSSSQTGLRSCFYILLHSRGHKSLGRTQQHLPYSPHLTASLPLLRLRSHLAWAGIGYSSYVSLINFFIQILRHHCNSPWTSSQDCPLSAPRSIWHECEFGSLCSELP